MSMSAVVRPGLATVDAGGKWYFVCRSQGVAGTLSQVDDMNIEADRPLSCPWADQGRRSVAGRSDDPSAIR